MKILIVEDNADLRAIYDSLFSAAGHKVKACDNGLTAVTEAVDFHPEAVLLDIMMPEMNGYEFLTTLRNNTSMAPFIVVCSNVSEQNDIAKAMAAGAHHYIRKSEAIGQTLVDEVVKHYEQFKASGQV